MKGVNKVILIGNVGKDPEIRFLGNGDAVANFSMATTESWNDKNTGEKVENTEWHRISAFKKLAEIIRDYVKKGSPVYVEGKIETKKWQDKDGNERYTTGILIHNLVMLGGKTDNGNPHAQQSTPESAIAQPIPAPAAKAPLAAGFDDDIPF